MIVVVHTSTKTHPMRDPISSYMREIDIWIEENFPGERYNSRHVSTSIGSYMECDLIYDFESSDQSIAAALKLRWC